jgi:DNA-binding PucR family transcriptional regulator
MSASAQLKRPVVGERLVPSVRRMLQAAALRVEHDVEEVASSIADVLLEQVAEIPTDPVTRADAERHVREAVLAFCEVVAGGRRPDEFATPDSARQFARLFARRGVALGVLLRVHRLTLAVVVDAFEERFERSQNKATLIDAARSITELAFATHDVVVDEIGREYARERDEWTRGARAVRRQTIEAILTEKSVDPDQASRSLTYELRRHHVGVVLWRSSDPEAPDCPDAALEAAANRIAAELGGARPLLVHDSSRDLWAWIGTDVAADQEILGRLSNVHLTDGVRAGVGACAHGVEGFRRTHREAADTARVARLAARRPGTITSYNAVELATFMADDIARTRRFVQDQLGPLGRDDDEHRRLRVTLMLYLEEHGSRIATARRLGIHPNTVANRIRTCRELLDHDLSHRQVHLQVALSLAATLGPAVLSPGHKRS